MTLPGGRGRKSRGLVRRHGTGTKRFRHHIVGDLTLAYETMALNAEPAAPTAQSLTGLPTRRGACCHPRGRGYGPGLGRQAPPTLGHAGRGGGGACATMVWMALEVGRL